MLTPVGLAVADEDHPLAPQADLAGALIGYPRVHDRAEPGPAGPRPDRGRLHPVFAGKQPGKTAGRPELAAHRTPRSAQIAAAGAGCAVPPEDRDLTQLRSPGFPACTAAGRGPP